MSSPLWNQCLEYLQEELNAQQYNSWIRLLIPVEQPGQLVLLAPNQFAYEKVRDNFLPRLIDLVDTLSDGKTHTCLALNDAESSLISSSEDQDLIIEQPAKPQHSPLARNNICPVTHLDRSQTFETFVKGKSNQLSHAASLQVAEHPGSAYNPLYIYGGVGLGKTHLMHAIGNMIVARNASAKVLYLRSERFVQDMVKALQHNSLEEFKRYYRSLDALLIDDIQFFAGKERTQEEFFHTFNALLEGNQQIILTCDRFPKEVTGLEDRLKTRFAWGLSIAIEPPDLETRVAILLSKAQQMDIVMSDEVAFFIAKRIRSNVRELEGALKRVAANARFTGKSIDVSFAKESLKDLLALQDKQVTLENIQKTVAEYFKIRLADLLSQSRSRSVARPRQVAMYLAKELTNHSLPEIGGAFGGRDHTTVLHACRKVVQLRESDNRVNEDVSNLYRILTT